VWKEDHLMGYLSALAMANAAPSLEMALEWHLSHNHYPPVPVAMVGPAREAIDAYHDEDYDRLITLPDGVVYRDDVQAPAWAIVEQHHLDAFIEEVAEYHE
jgi:hypothetical protein